MKGKPPSSRCQASMRFVDGEIDEREMTVPFVLAAVGIGAQRVAHNAVRPLTLASPDSAS